MLKAATSVVKTDKPQVSSLEMDVGT